MPAGDRGAAFGSRAPRKDVSDAVHALRHHLDLVAGIALAGTHRPRDLSGPRRVRTLLCPGNSRRSSCLGYARPTRSRSRRLTALGWLASGLQPTDTRHGGGAGLAPLVRRRRPLPLAPAP